MTLTGYLANAICGVYFFFFASKQGLFGLLFDLVYLFLFPGAAFFTWHMSLYQALRLNSGLWYAAFFVTFAIQILFFGLLAVGILSGGAGGILGTIGAIASGSLVSAILIGFCTALMVFNLLASIYLIQSVGRHYWNRGEIAKDVTQAASANPNIVQYALKTLS